MEIIVSNESKFYGLISKSECFTENRCLNGSYI
jgi:hypothetical protein